MQLLFVKLSSLLGVPPDHLKLTFSIFATYPYAFIFKKYAKDSTTMKHSLSIAFTSFIMLSVLRLYTGFFHITATCLVSYFLLYFFKDYQHIAWINFMLVIFSMSICHIGRQLNGIEGDTTLDYSGALMVVTIKLSSFGFNIVDGHQLIVNKKLNLARVEKMKIVQFPDLISYFAWCFFFAGFLVGPTCEYMDYIRFVHQSTPHYSNTMPSLKKLSASLLFLLPIIFLAPTYNYYEALKPSWKHKTLLQKILFLQISAILIRCKYYFIWFLSEGACILSGLGFNGLDKNGDPQWNKLTNVNVFHCEFAQSYRELSANWNMATNHWLRHYVYLRTYSSSATRATIMTYIVSSVWHGFYPGYYIFFVTAGILQLVARKVRRVIRPFFMGNKSLKLFYDISTWLISMGTINMLCPCFVLLHIPLVWQIWSAIY